MEFATNRNVIIIDDSIVVLNMVEKSLKKHLDNITIHRATNYHEAEELIQNIFFHAAIVDVTLPDANDGMAVDLTVSMNIPTVVLTGTTDTELKGFLLSKNIFDLILKNNINNISYVVFAIRRILKNYSSHVLVVDDSSSMRQMIGKLLKKLHVNVLEAIDPLEGIKILEQNPSISIIITDYEMPNMNGLEFTLQLRQKYRKDTLSIIGLSAVDDSMLATKFLKHGANDFLQKPFHQEEFFVRVNTQLELLEMFQYNDENRTKDFLTGLRNRESVLQQAEKMILEAERNNQPLRIALLEIDNLKAISSENGFLFSDCIIKKFSEILETFFPLTSITGRLSDHVFCVFDLDQDAKSFVSMIELIRSECENVHIQVENQIGCFTISAGIYEAKHKSLNEHIALAEKNLEKAQKTGHNKIVSTYLQLETPKDSEELENTINQENISFLIDLTLLDEC